MSQNVSLIGVRPEELPWLRLLITLLRHADGSVPELTRQALQYLSKTAVDPHVPAPETHEIDCFREVL